MANPISVNIKFYSPDNSVNANHAVYAKLETYANGNNPAILVFQSAYPNNPVVVSQTNPGVATAMGTVDADLYDDLKVSVFLVNTVNSPVSVPSAWKYKKVSFVTVGGVKQLEFDTFYIKHSGVSGGKPIITTGMPSKPSDARKSKPTAKTAKKNKK
ncbi:MAG: hypothetical protein U0U67_10600 [Chitinophagales bacterium]